MRAILSVLFAVIGLQVHTTEAQVAPNPDSLVAYWLNRGALASWSPASLYLGCPTLQQWQQRGINLLLSAQLSEERVQDLAKSWMGSVGRCSDTRLEQWYFEHINAGMQQLANEDQLHYFWQGLKQGDSPTIRDYLRNVMLDEGRNNEYRERAGVALFSRFTGQERMREYLTAFDTGHMPEGVAVGQTTHLLAENPDKLLREVGDRVRRNVRLANQPAFLQAAQASYRYASQPARRGLADALEEGLRQPGLTGDQRLFLNGQARLLRQPPS